MEIIKQLAALGNTGAHTEGYVDRAKGKFAYRKVDGPITVDMIAAHLNGTQPLGMYLNVDEAQQKSHFLVLDFDDHDKKGIAYQPTLEVAMHLAAREIPFLVFRSGGGHGYHIWLAFENSRRVDTIKEDAKRLLAGVESDGATFVAVSSGNLNRAVMNAKGQKIGVEHGVEVLPKGFGEQNVALPCSRASVPMRLEKDGTTVSLVECALDDLELQFVPTKKAGRKKADDAAGVDNDAAFDAFIQKYDPDNRDEWGAAGICLQAAFGKENAWARGRWVEWSKTSPKYRAGDETEWDGLSGANQYSPLSFWRIAKEHGYSGDWPFKAAEQRKLLALDFLADTRILRDQSDVAYAELKPREWVRIDTNDFKNRCAYGMLREYGKLPQEQDVKGAQMIALAQAAETAPEHVDLRFARVGGKRYVFLADPARTIIEIDDEGWRVNNDAPVQFRKGVGLPMSLPEQGELSDLINFLNVDDDSMVFLLAWMVTAIINPGQQCPIAILDGSAGSAKSSTLATLIEILDPRVGAQAGEPGSEDDLVVTAYQSAVMSFDNVEALARLSDALCRLSTGGGLSKRKLYSDGDVFAVDAMRPLLIAGLDPTFYKQDLIERIVRVTLTRPKAYMDEDEFRAYRAANMARWRGALYSLVSRVLRDVHSVKQTSSRFGVFSRAGECVARALGKPDGWFGLAYAKMRLEMAEEAATADSVYIFLVDYLAAGDNFIGTKVTATAAELFLEMKSTLADLSNLISMKDVPGNARAISPRIVQASTLLEKAHGWRVSRGRHREFIFEKVAKVEATADDILALMRDHQNGIADAAGF
ncbi:PriCT-2 domain-containing protein [Tropicimonas sp. IMCC34043]|uniref:TOTE conflict system archaeo-eukaryotic primase domain-containing protein n=1 Tax=Tropicimonas sp. IMCC34043 TaxID=2248760 RepID=UPI00130032E5|nr:PriCT-2 domain-containing protein [Tropicimonas sp. IMCC34043]